MIKSLIKNLKTLFLHFANCSLFNYKEKECSICNDSKQMEVLVMGTDTEYVECSYCSNKIEFKKFQESLKQ